MAGEPTAPKVANPHLAALRRLRSELAADAENFRDALKPAAADMGGRKVWTGRTASRWEQDVTHQRSRVQTLVDRLLPIIDAEIARTPEQVSQAEAKQHQNPRYFST